MGALPFIVSAAVGHVEPPQPTLAPCPPFVTIGQAVEGVLKRLLEKMQEKEDDAA